MHWSDLVNVITLSILVVLPVDLIGAPVFLSFLGILLKMNDEERLFKRYLITSEQSVVKNYRIQK